MRRILFHAIPLKDKQPWVFYSVRFACVLGPLQLDLEPLGADLVAVHGLDGGVGCLVGGERDESCLI